MAIQWAAKMRKDIEKGGRDGREALGQAMSSMLDVCGTLSADDGLIVLQVVWSGLAKQTRNRAIIRPEKFNGEQGRRLRQLDKIARLVREDTPDLRMAAGLVDLRSTYYWTLRWTVESPRSFKS